MTILKPGSLQDQAQVTYVANLQRKTRNPIITAFTKVSPVTSRLKVN